VSVAAFQSRRPIGDSECRKIFRKADKQFDAEIRVSDFTAAELNYSLHTITFLKEANRVVLLEVVIVIVGARAEFQLLHLHDVLPLPGIVRLLLQLILVVLVVDNFRHRRHRSGGDHDEIQAEFLGSPKSSGHRHNFRTSVRKYDANLARPHNLEDQFALGLSLLPVGGLDGGAGGFGGLTGA